MGEVGGGLEMPVSAALDQFDAAARMALCDRHDDHAHRPGRNLVAEPRRNLPRVERFVAGARSEEHTSELQSLMRTSYAVFCLKKKTTQHGPYNRQTQTTDVPN